MARQYVVAVLFHNVEDMLAHFVSGCQFDQVALMTGHTTDPGADDRRPRITQQIGRLTGGNICRQRA